MGMAQGHSGGHGWGGSSQALVSGRLLKEWQLVYLWKMIRSEESKAEQMELHV